MVLIDSFFYHSHHFTFQFVHKHLMEMGGGIVSELTPTALYEIFVQLCRTKLHMIISYNTLDEKMLKILRKHKAILNSSVHCILKVKYTKLVGLGDWLEFQNILGSNHIFDSNSS